MRNRINYYMSDKTPYDIAKYRVQKLRRFYIHLLLFSIASIIYIAKTYFGAPLNFSPFDFLNQTIILIWAFIILIKAIKLFSSDLFFGKKWEEKKMKELMGEEKSSKWE